MIKNQDMIPEELARMDGFSRDAFIREMKKAYSILYRLRSMLGSGDVIHVGWNRYTVPKEKHVYHHRYSDAATEIAGMTQEEYPDALFQVFETVQLNEFMNHQIAHNAIFLYVENELEPFVFDTLWRKRGRGVMLKPRLEEYYRYFSDDMVVVGRLPSESPKGKGRPWESRLEKILVDIMVDKLLKEIVPAEETGIIVREAFESYYIDDKAMFRHARRKGAEKKLEEAMKCCMDDTLEADR